MMRKGHKDDQDTTTGTIIAVLTVIATLFYSFITPMYQIPDWCLDAYHDPNTSYYKKDDTFFVSC